VGSKKNVSKFRITKAEVREKKARSQLQPEPYMRVGSVNYWRFRDSWYVDDDNLNGEDVAALINSYGLQLKKRISEAKTAASAGRAPDGSLRDVIPEDVRLKVWARD
jgi:hypothetical protein